MARRKSFASTAKQMARSSAQNQRERQRQERAKQIGIERERKNQLKLSAQASKEEKQRYFEGRVEETDSLNKELQNTIHELSSILETTLNVDNSISFDKLRIHEEFGEFNLPPELQKEPVAITREGYFSKISKPSTLDKLIPGWEKRHQKQLDEGEKLFKEYQEKFEVAASERNRKIAALKDIYNQEKSTFDAKIKQRNEEIDEFETAYKNNDPTAIIAYYTLTLERSDYPNDFPQKFKIAYVPESKELVIEYDLPHKSVVPAIAEYKYTKTKDVIEEKPRKTMEIKEIYQDIVAAVCLRTIHEVFETGQNNQLDIVVFNGFVDDVDPATGKDIRPCLISIRATKGNFKEINLAKVDKKACLRNLGAQVSARPDELMAVKPVVEFNMVDKRFVEESDVLSDLESRPNLMDLNPWEFENLVNNLFSKMGLEAKLTRSSKDGGVDVVAFDARPILGGKVVIQAKRYKNVVGVSAVRDLYGTMINEGASKGILVATSHYGPDAYDFAKDKPIELVDGGGLLYLLDQNGVKARIIFPDD